ncbi:MAG: hypothetical protein HY914_10925 [Desulfomonile tiedjei]|nr:hypothetical protein [Desulfomonile tiedjei]
MQNVMPEGKGTDDGTRDASPCCSSADGQGSSCCNPKQRSWSRGRTLISVIVITAAIAVGTHSWVTGTSLQSGKTTPTQPFSSSLAERSSAPGDGPGKLKPQSQRGEALFIQTVDSLKAMETLAADTDVAFIMLRGERPEAYQATCAQIQVVLNKLQTLGKRIGVFTLPSNVPDYARLVRHFSVEAFPCVVVLGRQGTPSAVSGDISEARLYYAFVQASQPGSCCPTQGNAACCPK